MPEWSIPEVVRRLDDITKQLAQLTDKLEATYLRKDVYQAERLGDQDRVKTLADDVDSIFENQRWNRRLAISGLVLPILTSIIAALLIAAVVPK